MGAWIGLVTILILAITTTASFIDVDTPPPITTSFGVSRYHLLPQTVHTLYEYFADPSAINNVVTYFWLTGSYGELKNGTWIDSAGNMIFTVYVDGELAYQFTPYQLVGVGFSDSTAPWGFSTMGKASLTGGIYSHMRVPFFKSIRYDVQLPPDANQTSKLFWQIRHTANMPIIISGITLPIQTRLIQYRFDNVTLDRLEFVKFVSTNNSGLVHMHFFQGASSTPNFMEGCYRAFYGGDSTTQHLLSTGFEDYYQSAYYFDAGEYHYGSAGCTHYDILKNITNISAYKIHETDPLFFPSGGFEIVWRVGDTLNETTGEKCMDPNGPVVANPQPTTIIAHTWVYEWPAQAKKIIF